MNSRRIQPGRGPGRALMLVAVLGLLLTSSGCRERSSSPQVDPSAAPIKLTPSPAEREKVEAARRLQGLANAQAIRNAVQNFYQANDRYPVSLDELIASGFLSQLPAAPSGTRFVYHPETGEVDLAPDGSGERPPDLPSEITREEAIQWAGDLRTRSELKKIEVAIRVYQADEGRFPPSLDELVRRGILLELPAPPSGARYSYDPNTGVVSVVPINSPGR